MPLNKNNFKRLTMRADAQVPGMERRLAKVLRLQTAAFADQVSSGSDATATLNQIEGALQKQLIAAKGDWPLAFAVDGWNIAGVMLGKRAFILDLEAKIDAGKAGVSTNFDGADELVANHLRANVQRYIEETSKLESKTTAKKFNALYRAALTVVDDDGAGLTPAGLAKTILEEGLAWSGTRANLMARTVTNWGYNEGAVALYETEGIQKAEWVSTIDEVVGEWDASLNGKVVPLNTPFVAAGESFVDSKGKVQSVDFDIYHPPLHPNCRCTVVPVVEF